jgi:high-affinity nickel-transport protein
MTLCDSLNGVAMMRMYRSALDDPRRRLGFNAAVTGISALSALFIAAITLGGFVNTAFGLQDPVTSWLGTIDLGDAGLLLITLLLAVWGAASLKRSAPPPSGLPG